MTSTEGYQKSLDSLYKSFHLILEEVGKTFPLYKLYPNSSQYREEFESDVSNLENIKSEIFLMMTKLQNDVGDLTKTTNEFNKKIERLNKENRGLKNKLNKFENADTASYGELQTRIKNYYFELAENIILILIAGTAIGFYAKNLNKN